MTTRNERDKQKSLQEKHQAILSDLLKDEDNKYCVDCDAKGPRWASWNLGIFLCIRCAGIHRNLGVHISKVKSVNLDSWYQEQIAMVQEMGNSRARAVYEANLPDNYRRPQTDSALEAFIRSKYEQKKYIAKEWIPPKPKVPQAVSEEKKEKKRARPKPSSTIQLTTPKRSPQEARKVERVADKPPEKPAPAPVPASADLLGLDTPAPSNNDADPFGDFLGGPAIQPVSQTATAPANELTGSVQPGASDDLSLLGENGSTNKEKSTKESILALYGSGSQQATFGVPGGMYLPSQPPQSGGGMVAPGMMPGGMGMQTNMQGGNMMPGMQQQAASIPTSIPTSIAMDQSVQYMQQQLLQQQLQQQQAAIFLQQQQANMMMAAGQIPGGHMAGAQQGQMGMMPGMQTPQQQAMMMQGQQPQMYNMMGGNMFTAQQQQQHLSQVQNQLASMKINPQNPTGMSTAVNGISGGFQHQGAVAAGAATWGTQQGGTTLSTNLWQ